MISVMTECMFPSILGRSQTIEKNQEKKKRVIQSDAKQEQSFSHL